MVADEVIIGRTNGDDGSFLLGTREIFWGAVDASPSNVGLAIAVTAVAGIAVVATLVYTSRRRKPAALLPQQWRALFTPDGKLSDGGVKFLKKARVAGVDPSIRSEVWPFLLGVYDIRSSKEERDKVRAHNRKKYEDLRRQCRKILKRHDTSFKPKEVYVGNRRENGCADENNPSCSQRQQCSFSTTTSNPSETSTGFKESDFVTWQRTMRVDAVRANGEWITYSPSQASSVSESRAQRLAKSVRLRDYNHLEPCRIHHAARLVRILEAYALYDPEIGYCQGMSDLLTPIIAVVDDQDDFEAFWCFVGFMRKARHNFRLDEMGIRRQLDMVSKIIRCQDGHLYEHLKQLQAEDCFFVYRMVVVLLRRELSFEQTLNLWEVMWADQAAIRAGIGKSGWGRMMRFGAPPTDDLLLYAIAAGVLQRRKMIIERFDCMEEIMRECNGMAGNLDVWKLLDDAHDLVVNLHEKI
ncbi:unnamed protein product [Linum trigynum]|uniref:Rab-GAP TBC domain-containing protein n=1 Tax=Linum trigynum TaxID=586398 RepID=A0AAV2EMC7_9ROSI